MAGARPCSPLPRPPWPPRLCAWAPSTDPPRDQEDDVMASVPRLVLSTLGKGLGVSEPRFCQR